jgi:hypothetical protein
MLRRDFDRSEKRLERMMRREREFQRILDREAEMERMVRRQREIQRIVDQAAELERLAAPVLDAIRTTRLGDEVQRLVQQAAALGAINPAEHHAREMQRLAAWAGEAELASRPEEDWRPRKRAPG